MLRIINIFRYLQSLLKKSQASTNHLLRDIWNVVNQEVDFFIPRSILFSTSSFLEEKWKKMFQEGPKDIKLVPMNSLDTLFNHQSSSSISNREGWTISCACDEAFRHQTENLCQVESSFCYQRPD